MGEDCEYLRVVVKELPPAAIQAVGIRDGMADALPFKREVLARNGPAFLGRERSKRCTSLAKAVQTNLALASKAGKFVDTQHGPQPTISSAMCGTIHGLKA